MACTRFVAIIKINRPGTTTRITKLNCSLFIRSYKYSQFSRFGDHTHCTDIGGRSIVLPFIKRQRDTHIHVHVGWNHHSCGRRNQAAKKGWKSIFIKIDMLKSIVRHHPRHARTYSVFFHGHAFRPEAAYIVIHFGGAQSSCFWQTSWVFAEFCSWEVQRYAWVKKHAWKWHLWG